MNLSKKNLRIISPQNLESGRWFSYRVLILFNFVISDLTHVWRSEHVKNLDHHLDHHCNAISRLCPILGDQEQYLRNYIQKDPKVYWE